MTVFTTLLDDAAVAIAAPLVLVRARTSAVPTTSVEDAVDTERFPALAG